MKGLSYLLLVFAVFGVVMFLARPGARGSPSGNAVLADANPTVASVPTWTATFTAEQAAIASRTPTPKPPTATPPPTPSVAISKLMNVRGGPGTNYNIIGQANVGDQFRITGKNPGLGDWWQIDYNGQTGWVYADLVSAQNADYVQVALVIPAPPPAAAIAKPVARSKPTKTPQPVSKPSDLHIDLLSLLEYNRQFVGEEVYIEAEVIQVIGPQVEYTLIIYDGQGYGYLNLDNTPVPIYPGDVVVGIVEVSGTHTYENTLGYDVTVPLLYGIDLDLFR